MRATWNRAKLKLSCELIFSQLSMGIVLLCLLLFSSCQKPKYSAAYLGSPSTAPTSLEVPTPTPSPTAAVQPTPDPSALSWSPDDEIHLQTNELRQKLERQVDEVGLPDHLFSLLNIGNLPVNTDCANIVANYPSTSFGMKDDSNNKIIDLSVMADGDLIQIPFYNNGLNYGTNFLVSVLTNASGGESDLLHYCSTLKITLFDFPVFSALGVDNAQGSQMQGGFGSFGAIDRNVASVKTLDSGMFEIIK